MGMTYEEAIAWLFDHLPMYQRIGGAAYKKDLTNTIKLCTHFNNPQNRFPSVHVAGTNGKGSCSHMLAAVLQEAGYKVGLYTSPHLKSFTERIKVNGDEISQDYVLKFVDKNKLFFEAVEPSFFEMTVALAFNYFADEKVDIAIIETGMGGRLDSTNIITPLISVITNIGLDHQQFLGETLGEIAFEKAGIIKHSVPVVVGESNPETDEVFIKKAKECESDIYFADRNWAIKKFELTDMFVREVELENGLKYLSFKSPLAGEYQLANFRTVAEVLFRLEQTTSFRIPLVAEIQGQSRVVELTGLKGRWQRLGVKPTIIADTGHNIHGLSKVIGQLVAPGDGILRMVIGFVNDKKIDDLMQILPRNAVYYFTQASIPRAMPVHELFKLAVSHQLQGTVFGNVQDAVNQAINDSSENDLIFIGGSNFVVAEVV